MRKGTLAMRLALAALVAYALLNLGKIAHHFSFFLSDELINWTITGNWTMAVMSAVFFLSFIFLLRYRRKASWKERGIYSAFIISLFVEMYGFPLSIYLTSGLLKGRHVSSDIAYDIRFLGYDFGINDIIVFGGVIVALGTLLIIWGWHDIYMSKGKVASQGIYSYSRHPQYLGMILVTLGWTIIWPTILTLILCPVLVYIYIGLCFREEKENMSKEYLKYKDRTPMFI